MITIKSDPKLAGIPAFLQTQNIRPLSPELAARLATWSTAPSGQAEDSFRRRHPLTERDLAVIAELEIGGRDRAAAAFYNRTERARARTAREGRWAPGCSWDTKRGRWTHPTSTWNGSKWVQRTGAAHVAAPTQPGETDMSKKAKKRAAPAKKAAGGSRSVSRPCGKVSDFHPVRDGTARAIVLRMGMAGGHTVDAVATKIGKDRATVMTHLFCLFRDCGVGYDVVDNKLSIALPGSKTLDDAIGPAAKAA